MSPPRFDVTLTRFRLVLPNHTLYDAETLRWLETMTRDAPLSEPQRQSLAFVRHSHTLSNPDYCRVTGVDSRVATRELSELVERGIRERDGVGRWSTYTLTGRPADSTRRAPQPREDRGRQIVELLRGSGPLSAREMAERLGLSASAIRYWLPRLREAGSVVPTESDPNAPGMRYRLARSSEGG